MGTSETATYQRKPSSSGRRAAIYTRISLDRTGEQLGVQRQLDDCRRLAKRLGVDVVAHYEDNDISAFSGKTRPGFEALLDSMKRGEVDVLLCWHVDRLYRRLKDLVRLLDVAATVDIETVNGGGLDLSTATGRMQAQILGAVAENESSHKAERQRRAAAQLAERGIPHWRKAYGYLRDEHDRIVVDPVRGPLVARVYAAILSGCSLNDGCRLLNEAPGGLPDSGTPWSPSTLSLFLRKPRNAGLRAHNDEVVGAGTWPALVGEPTWRAVQHVMATPGRAPGRKTVRKHLLTGVLRCGRCDDGSRLSGQWVMQPTGGQSGRLAAGATRRVSTEKSHRIAYACKQCRGNAVRAELVEPMVLAWVSGRLAEPDAVDLLKAEQHDSAEAERVRLERRSLETELDNIAVERAEKLLTGRQAQIATGIVQAKIDALDAVAIDQERLRVFDGIPLGTPEAGAAVEDLAANHPDRYRAVIAVLLEVTVIPVGKGGKAFKPERVIPTWR